jgi:molybdopterin/thiamine biosynthesis adenylyltransferase
MNNLSIQELERYKRQMMLEGFDRAHQEKLKDSAALVSGIGGLGGTAAVYLAVAGIGKMIFAHSGDLTMSNMNRQILMKHDWIGKTRVVQGKQSINDINPDVRIEIWDARTNDDNVDALLSGVDIALSARPTFYERRALNKGCVRHGIPMVEAAMNGMEGYMFNIVPGKTPCLNCLYPEDDPLWKELGFPVLGAVSGMLGCLMAIETVKLLTGFRKPLLGKMVHFDTASMDFRKLAIRRDENCKVCGGRAGH